MLAPEAPHSLIGWEPMNPQIIPAMFATKKDNIKLNIIQCYAQTNEAEDKKKDNFYEQLQYVLDKQREKDITIITSMLRGADNRS